MSQSRIDEIDLELVNDNPQKNDRIRRLFLKLRERAKGADSMFPILLEVEKDEFLLREAALVKDFQQIILDFVFNYIKSNNKNPLIDKSYGLTINDIATLKSGINELITNFDRKDVLEKYDIPSLVYFLSQIRKFYADKRNTRIRNNLTRLEKETSEKQTEINQLKSQLDVNDGIIKKLIAEKEKIENERNKELQLHSKDIEAKNELISKKESERINLELEKSKLLENMSKKEQDQSKKEQDQNEIAALRGKYNEMLKKGMTLETELGMLKAKNAKLEEGKVSADKELKTKEKLLGDNKKNQNEIQTKLKSMEDRHAKLIEANQKLEHDLFDNLHAVKQKVNSKPFYLISIDLNNVSASWNKNSTLRFQINDLFTLLLSILKKIDSTFDINDVSSLKGLIFFSAHNKKYEIESKALLANSEIAEFIKKFRWVENNYRKGNKEQDIDTQLMAESIEHIVKYQDKIKGFLLASGDIDFIFAIKKAKEFDIKCYLLSHKKAISKELSENVDSVFYF